jgi:hypothetical protein
VACNLHKIATVNLRDLEAALDLIGEMAMSVPTNHAQDYLDTISDSGILNNSIRDLILTAFEAGWMAHEQWLSDFSDNVLAKAAPELFEADQAYEAQEAINALKDKLSG